MHFAKKCHAVNHVNHHQEAEGHRAAACTDSTGQEEEMNIDIFVIM